MEGRSRAAAERRRLPALALQAQFRVEEFGRPKTVDYKAVDYTDKADQERRMRAIRDEIRHEHDFAHEGPTFDRLKRAQPTARDDDIREAIKAALKLMDARSKYFDRDYTDFGSAIDDALEKAKRENPGSLDVTGLNAGTWLV